MGWWFAAGPLELAQRENQNIEVDKRTQAYCPAVNLPCRQKSKKLINGHNQLSELMPGHPDASRRDPQQLMTCWKTSL
jgi:hypothetical protein